MLKDHSGRSGFAFFLSWSVHLAVLCARYTSFLTGWVPVQLAEEVPVQFDMWAGLGASNDGGERSCSCLLLPRPSHVGLQELDPEVEQNTLQLFDFE